MPSPLLRPQDVPAPAWFGRYNFQREEDLIRLTAVLGSAEGPSVVLLAGEPGIGRKYLLQAAVHRLGQAGHQSALLGLKEPIAALKKLLSGAEKEFSGELFPDREAFAFFLAERPGRVILHVTDPTQFHAIASPANPRYWLPEVAERFPHVKLAVSCGPGEQATDVVPGAIEVLTMQICKNCYRLFDPDITPDRFADSLLCSWHPGTPENGGNTGPGGDYAEIWVWSCCGSNVVGPLVTKVVDGVTHQCDYPPSRSPGCKKGPHEADDSVKVADPKIAAEVSSLQERLRDLEAYEARGLASGSIFISYSHKDADFVDQLIAHFSSDKISFWRDEKDILVGDVIDRAISEGIQKHSLFLIVLTASSVKSGWVQREFDEAAHEAVEGGKIILPIIAKGLSLTNVPPRVRRFKCADFNGTNFELSYDSLLRSIKSHMQRFELKEKTTAGQLRITVKSTYTGAIRTLIVNPNASVKWLVDKAQEEFSLSREAEIGASSPFMIRWVLVDARAEDVWDKQLSRSGQRRVHALVLSDHGLRTSFSNREKLSEIGVYDGIVFHLKAIEDDEEPAPTLKHGF